MKYLLLVVGLLTAFATSHSHADVPGTIWLGTSADLYRDGKLLCSTDATKSPVYVSSAGYAEIHKGGLGWIWPLFAQGCANHVYDRFQLQISGSHLKDFSGSTVGSISATGFEASNFSSEKMLIKEIKFATTGKDEATVYIIFQKQEAPGQVFEFMAKYRFYQNE